MTRSPFARPIPPEDVPTTVDPTQPGDDPQVRRVTDAAFVLTGNAGIAEDTGLVGVNMARLADEVLSAVTQILVAANDAVTHYLDGAEK